MKGQLSKITYDPESDVLYIYLTPDPAVARTRNFSDEIVLDFDAQDKLVGVEILDVKRGFDLADVVSRFDLDPSINQILEHVKSLIPTVEKEFILA